MDEVHTPHDAEHSHADLDRHLRAAYVVFGTLLVLTGVTVGVSYLHLPTHQAIALALVIALIKGSLVAAWFMHLVSERHLILAVLGLTAGLFLVLLLLPVITAHDHIKIVL
jgi:cytochrome c oxidase subunit IV